MTYEAIENPKQKLDALRVATDAMASVLTVNPSAFDRYPDIFGTLAQLRMDLIDAIEEQTSYDL